MNKINWWSTSFGEEEIDYISNSIRNKKISQGSVTQKFEEEFASMIGCRYALAVPSGTVAVYLGLMGQGVYCRDEVIVPNYTAIGSAHAAYMLGCKIKFVDIRNDKPVIDENKIEENISENTKAIIAVHYNGIRCNMDKIHKLAQKYKLAVVEDAAQAMFSMSDNKYMGTTSSAGAFSFSVAKIISTGQGGMAITNDKEIYTKMFKIRNQERGSFNYQKLKKEKKDWSRFMRDI